MDLATFLSDLPEFDTSQETDESKPAIPASAITFWINLGTKMLNADRWGNIIDEGVELFTAHNVALEMLAQRDMNAGGIPGIAKGIVSGKSAGDVNIQYDTNSTMDEKAGHWNYTTYGQRFIRLSNMVGAGPIQVHGCGSMGPWSGSGGW